MARKGAKEYFMILRRREVHKEENDGAQRRKGHKGIFYAPTKTRSAQRKDEKARKGRKGKLGLNGAIHLYICGKLL